MTQRARLAALVAGPGTRRAVRRALTRRLPSGTEIGPLRLGRVTWKPSGRLRCFYSVTLGGVPGVVAVRWESIEPGAPRAIEVWPDDSHWPHVVDALGESTYTAALGAAGWKGGGSFGVGIVRYRPGQRHVVRLTATDRTEVYLKVGPVGSGGRTAARAAALAEACRRVGLDPASPCWFSDSLGAVAVPTVPGTPLVPAPRPDPVELAHVARLGAVLAGLHRLPRPGLTLDHSPPADARTLTRRACEHVVALHPDVAVPLESALDGAVEMIGTGDRTVLLHGDAKIDHFLVSGPDLGVIDLDSVRIGDPAEDLGRLLASVWWDTEPGSREAVRNSLVAGYGPGEIPSRRLAGWTTLATIRQAARRIPVLDPALGERMIELLRTLPPP